MPVLQRSIVVVDFPIRLLTVPVDRTEVMFTIRVVVRCEVVELLDGLYQAQHIGECLYPRRYHNVMAAPAELVV